MSGSRVCAVKIWRWVAGLRIAGLRRVGVAVVAAAALCFAAIPAATAQTADTVTINSVTSPSPGEIAVSVTSTTPLTELDVTLTSGTHPSELELTLADFTLQSDGTTYLLTTPLTDAQLPFDIYTVVVQAQDSGGGSAVSNSTTFPWLIQPTITLSASSPFDYNNQSVTFSGTLSLVDPDGSAVNPALLAGQPLVLTDADTYDPVTTGAGGTYSITLSPPDNDASYTVMIYETPSQAPATSPAVIVSATQDPVLLTAAVSATQLNYGQMLSVSGTVTYNPGSGYVPLPDSTVEVYGGPYYDETGPAATVTTNAEGQYVATFADDGPGQFYVYAGAVPGSDLLEFLTQASVVTANVNVALPVKITELHASLSQFGILTLTGCLTAGNSDIPPALPLQVQYAPGPSGPWHTLRTVHGLGDNTCGSAPVYGLPFDYQVPVAVASAYYRLSYPGSKDYLPAASTAIHEAKILTKITNFRISPRSVARNGYVTVSGRLWKDVKGWHPLARQRVWILFHYKSTWYYYPDKPLTNSAGRFSARLRAYVTAPWIAEFMGSKVYFAAATAELKVKVTSSSGAVGELAGAAPQLDRFAGEVLPGTGLRLVSERPANS